MHPTRTWGPAKVEDRELVDYVPGFVFNPWKNRAINENAENEFKLLENTLQKV